MPKRLATAALGQLLFAVLISTFAALTGGPASADDKPPVLGEVAPDFELTSLGGEKLRLSKLIADGPVVLVVLRGYPGYQCPFCTTQFGDFLSKADAFRKVGSKVVFVYPGPSDKLKEHANEFVRGKDIPNHFYMLLDPDYTFTNRYGLRWNEKNETAYPSTFVFDKTGKTTFAVTSKAHDDRAKAEDALKALPAK